MLGPGLCNKVSAKGHSLTDPHRNVGAFAFVISVAIQRLFMGSSGIPVAMNLKPLEFLLDQKDLKKYRCTILYQKLLEE